MKRAWFLCFTLFPIVVWGQTPPASTFSGGDSVTIKLFWNYDSLPKEMRVFELRSGEKKKLWDTDVVKEPGALPIGNPIPGDTLLLKPGQNKKFVLVFKNTTGKSLDFFAAPHQMKPEANALGYKFKCLCINRVYEVKPGYYWYRVVEMRVSPQVSGNYLEVTHSLFGVSVEKARGMKFQPMGNMDMDQGM